MREGSAEKEKRRKRGRSNRRRKERREGKKEEGEEERDYDDKGVDGKMWWRVIGIYVNNDIERKLESVREWMEEREE